MVAYAFGACAFLSSFLLFLVQPLQGKMLLPYFGGAPAVWNTCMVTFQSLLLLGYLYAHLVSTKLRLRHQVVLHLTLLAAAAVSLPLMLPNITVELEWLANEPVKWVLIVLAMTSGPAFFVVATSSPLLQSWLHATTRDQSMSHATTRTDATPPNPYVLYAAGNAGSLLALLGYPTLVEPQLRLLQQSWLWTAGYGLLFAFFAVLGLVAWRRAPRLPRAAKRSRRRAYPKLTAADLSDDPYADDDDIGRWTAVQGSGQAPWQEPLGWVVLAFLPSSLMLGVTTYMTTDVASIPMLWVLPLALYISSFAIVFWRYGARLDKLLAAVTPALLTVLVFLCFADYRRNHGVLVTLHLVGFFAAAMLCHGRLAMRKPDPARLTSYYLWLSLGGVLGGMFNAFAAPSLFTTVAEYPLVLALTLIAVPVTSSKVFRERIYAALATAAGAAAMAVMAWLYLTSRLEGVAGWFEPHLELTVARTTMLYALPLALTLAFLALRRPRLQGFAVLGVIATAIFAYSDESILHRSRSFYGVLTVKRHTNPPVNALVHGGILHGEQRMDSAEERAVPRSYYHPDGPLGQVIAEVHARREAPRIAVIGLGTGAVAAYGTRDNAITFYELDPHVERVARNPKLFTYVDDCLRRWCNLKVVLGDGRLKLLESEELYDLIVVDAFSSDSIPIHLITAEALEAYTSRLAEGGLIAYHISNRYVNLEAVLLNQAQEYQMGYAVRSEEGDESIGKGASTWAVLAGAEGIYEHVIADERWRGLEPRDGVGLWRDDYANVMRTFTWY